MAQDFYDLLGVSKNSTSDEIKKAYRKKAMELHPDRHGGDKQKEEEFKKINEAYSVIGDPQKKANYDKFGSAEGMGGGFSGGGFNADFDISDIFESFFGGQFNSGNQSRRKASENGEDLEMNFKLDFSEAIFGGKRQLKYDKKIICDICAGTGAKSGTKPNVCPTCHGTGQVKRRTQSFFGVIEQASACPTCHGSGQTIENPCEKCKGHKRIDKKIEKEIDIPAGIDDGMSIKLKGEGNEGANGKNGDLYITFRVPDSFEGLNREDDNLHYELFIDPIEAVIGSKSKKKIPLLGERLVEIKPGTQNEEILRFKGDGVKNISRDQKGDLFIHLKIKIPTHLSKKERELYEELAREKGIDHADHKGLFSKIFG